MEKSSDVKVSLLLPCYNTAPYLHQCMESVCNQSLKEIEIICVNDGSTDNTLEILKEYAAKDPRIIIVDKENGGYGKAMNVATSHATGKYIGIVEPDDYVSLDMFKTLYDAAEENNLDFVKADFNRFAKNDETGEIDYFYNQLSKDESKYNKVFTPLEDLECYRYIMNTWSGIYNRSFLEENKIVYNETPGASFQDNGFWFQTFAFAKRAMILNVPLYYNRRDNPNSSVKNPQKIYAMNVEYDWIRKCLENKPEIWNRVKGYYWLKKLDNYNATLNRIADEYKYEFVKRISLEFKRAGQTDELDWTLFTSLQVEKIKTMIKSADDFYNAYVLCKKPNQKGSQHKKVGYLTTGNPLKRKIVNCFRMLKNEGVKKTVKHVLKIK